MTDITLPIWIFAISVGVPCIGFLCLLLFKLRRIRKPQEDIFIDMPIRPREEPRPMDRSFQNNLIAMQIDAVFNGLNAIIETERIKISTLLNNPVHMGLEATQTPPIHQPHTELNIDEMSKAAAPSIGEKIANMAANGGQTADIAEKTGLSQAEIELALKMRSNRESTQHHKLEAVA